MTDDLSSHCSAAIKRMGFCVHGFMQNRGCFNYSIKNCIHGEHLDPQPRCLDEEATAPEWNLVKRHRERLERGEL